MSVTYQSTKDRIEELGILEDGWFDGKHGFALNKEGLAWLQGNLLDFEEPSLPWVFPTLDEEDILLEWSLGDWEIGLWINTKTKQGKWYGLDIGTDGFEEFTIDLQEDGWERIRTLIILRYLKNEK
jgi:hypothetical protein